MHGGPCQRLKRSWRELMDVFGLLCATGGSEAAEDVEPMANKKTKCEAHHVGLEQPIANGAKRTVLPGGGRKQVSLSRRVLPRGP